MNPPSATPLANSIVTQQFASYKQELDDKNDRYERLVKLSRDVTIQSKRAIFLLHRAIGDRQQSVCNDATKMINTIIQGPLRNISTELQSQDKFIYQRAISAGLQEFVEAYTLLGYLQNGSIPLLNIICSQLVYTPTLPQETVEPRGSDRDETTSVDLPPLDYILGIADLTGELMRRAVGSMSRGDLETPPALCKLLQTIEGQFRLVCTELGRDGMNKLNVLAASAAKVEKCCYAIKLRGSEFPQHLLASSIDEILPGLETGHGAVHTN